MGDGFIEMPRYIRRLGYVWDRDKDTRMGFSEYGRIERYYLYSANARCCIIQSGGDTKITIVCRSLHATETYIYI